MEATKTTTVVSLQGLPPANSNIMRSFADAVHKVDKSNRHTTFAAFHTPVLHVQPGELIHVETWDCYHGKICPAAPSPENLQRDELNPVTGPLYIQGAEPGDVLSVTLHDIRPNTMGIAICGCTSGQLCHTLEVPWSTKFFDVDLGGNTVTMQEEDTGKKNSRIASIQFDCAPMLGVIGVAPAGNDAVSTMPAGKHGGNLDNQLNGIGCTLHLPVNHPGALLSVGDMHASQGDGEIGGTGVEVGGDVLLSCQIIKRQQLQEISKDFVLEYPVTETATHWITHGVTVENIPGATTVACEQAQKLLVQQWGFTPEEAFILLGVKGDLGLCQACHPDKGTQIAKMVVPRLKSCPRPFRCQYEKDPDKT